uniref:Uncharacterized protein n=1 Tax=Myoviridae sp. ctTRu92 TaxID=2825111 RepID=A0A8S5Q711_9CAUD|nr:MAG TPA: hypothetical protein [Myoviridae sp. ctTRu92]
MIYEIMYMLSYLLKRKENVYKFSIMSSNSSFKYSFIPSTPFNSSSSEPYVSGSYKPS